MPCKHLRARSVIHHQHQNPLNSQKSALTINAYIKLTKSQDKTSNYHTLNFILIENSQIHPVRFHPNIRVKFCQKSV